MLRLGDPHGFATAYERHRGAALRAAEAILRDRAAAEDVVQEVFAELWVRPGRFDAGRAPLGSYVALRARSKAIDAQRARRSWESAHARAGAAAPAPPPETPADAAIRAEMRQRILAVLAQLPAAQRAAVLLTSANGFTMSELARITGAPLGTAKSRVRLGLGRTRALLESAA